MFIRTEDSVGTWQTRLNQMTLTAIRSRLLIATIVLMASDIVNGQEQTTPISNQWRGPTRDGLVPGSNWPTSWDWNIIPICDSSSSLQGAVETSTIKFSQGCVRQRRQREIAGSDPVPLREEHQGGEAQVDASRRSFSIGPTDFAFNRVTNKS